MASKSNNASDGNKVVERTGTDYRTFIYILLVASIVFSLEFPVAGLQTISRSASINTVDLAIVLISGSVIVEYLRNDGRPFNIVLPTTTTILILILAWIDITLIVAVFRSEQSIMASVLWTLKMFEIGVFFMLIQNQMDTSLSKVVLRTLNFTGLSLSVLAIGATLRGADRVRFFFDNPNMLAGFFVLVAMMNLSRTITSKNRRNILLFSIGTGIAILGVLSTISRAGMLGLIVGIAVLAVLHRHRFSRLQIYVAGALLATGLLTTPILIGPEGIDRLTNWIAFKNGRLMLANTPAAVSFEMRLNRIQYAIDLFRQQPIFGYGWYAAPSRVGYLDVYYTVLMVELGIPGVLLFFAFHLSLLRNFIQARQRGAITYGSAGIAWYCGLLAQAAGGSFPRIPQMIFITLLFVVAVWGVAMDG